MASIFTFDPSPPSVSSPWSTPRTSTPRLDGGFQIPGVHSRTQREVAASGDATSLSTSFDNDDLIVTSLEAEPQDGPTEYKLHLLLRPRREFVFSSTQRRISGSTRTGSDASRPIHVHSVGSQSPLSRAANTTPSRQIRLQQLTTQLLWRLQQSSSIHYTTYKQTSLPPLDPDRPTQELAHGPFPGLEDSKGALYEIGVADDGTFVGLAEDELDESLQTLTKMASSLRCTVSVLKKVQVGTCRWQDWTVKSGESENVEKVHTMKTSPLWVAEAYVRPMTGITDTGRDRLHSVEDLQPQALSVIDQLRVTLTGSTLSGKSSLLGTLTTGTLDNGRGKSRLSLLKHQHEIASGMTSSVTHELLGYSMPDVANGDTRVINFASGNVSSWIDVHASCEGGRLVFFSDSAGHPRFRRTTVRGLIGWSPNWTLLCIPADTLEDTSGRLGNTPPSYETLGLPKLEVDLSQDHLHLCLKLDIPLVIVITKIDLASRTGLRTYLNKILSVLKRDNRLPFVVPELAANDESCITAAQLSSIRILVQDAKDAPLLHVPIVLTSAVKGIGVKTLHALLQALPVTSQVQPALKSEKSITALFDIEDVYRGHGKEFDSQQKVVLSGPMRFGRISIGDELAIGPFQAKNVTTAKSPSIVALQRESSAETDLASEWLRVKVLSVRHLRLPTHALVSGQVGTIAVASASESSQMPWHAIRKGMILANGSPHANRTFIAQFARRDVDPLSIGSAVVVYFNSVRASAKIIAGAIVPLATQSTDVDAVDQQQDYVNSLEDHGAFAMDAPDDASDAQIDEQLLVTFRFLASREYVAVGSRVLVMPGGPAGLYGGGSRGEKGIAGLSGFVGLVVDSESDQ